MGQKIFSIKFNIKLDKINDRLSLGDFNELVFVTNINFILQEKNLKYKGDSPLSYQYNDDGLTITGIASSY
jgi:hypothetical protein